MRRQTVLACCCVLAISLAGCSGLGGGDENPGTTVTPMDTPDISTTGGPSPGTTARPNATFQGVAMPPGTDRRGIIDPGALYENLESHVVGTDFEIHRSIGNRRWQSGVVVENMSYSDSYRVDAINETISSRNRRVRRQSDSTTRFDSRTYLTGESGYVRTIEDGNTSYRYVTVRSFTETQRHIATGRIGQAFGADGTWTPVNTTTVADHEAIRFEYRPDSASDDVSANGTATIDSRGVVHSLTFTKVTDRYNSRRVTAIRYAFESRPNLTLEEPSWLDEARNATRADSQGATTRTHNPTTQTE